ncbi:ZIP family metal transporter [Cochleicola gelatinilyticus]|uniref:ZIP family metal transporter n=1 Tax=Cochleicola gelatinilyticus TaxID=1763537 RepID=A0A167H6B6_9FLAO|nr:ZIP family metal transporter [Cochleicola gelatinilyticus]OAB78261.1 ZIP family metal transporter [Cochleicola gelatinilyticus]
MIYLALFLAVAIGYSIALLLKTKQIKHLGLYLAFSGAFLLSITIFELLPEVFSDPSKKIGVFIMIGILLQIFLEFFSKGAEHGHVHLHVSEAKFPWLLFISLSIHALLEGFPISETNNLLIGVIVHKIPIAIILSFFFMKARYGKATTLLFLFFFALMTPLGAWLVNYFKILHQYHTEITAVVIGIFLHVSTTILFESSKDHKFNLAKLTTIIVAIVLAYLL